MSPVMNPSRNGFSLIEIMVGLAMGMIAMIVIMQVFSIFEGGKRTTTGGADAQSNGAIALYMIERDTKMAGWGMDTANYSTCNTIFSYCNGSASCGGGAAGAIGGLSFASVRITDGGAGPDALAAIYFANPNTSAFRFPANTYITKTMPQSSSVLDVTTVAACTKDADEDASISMMALVSQAGQCTLMKITNVQGPALKVQHNPGSNGEYNPPTNYQNDHNWPAYTSGAKVSCFRAASNGPVFERSYRIADGQLVRSDNTREPPAPAITDELVAPEIIDLQAQYGVAPVGSQSVNEWEDAAGATWAAPTLADMTRVKAVRVALVARSSQYEKPDSGACATTTPTMVEKWSTWAEFDTSGYPNDWQCYRYKVFETVVPLRNVLWGNL